MRFYRLRDPFIGVGIKLPSENFWSGSQSACTLNIELLFFGIAIGRVR